MKQKKGFPWWAVVVGYIVAWPVGLVMTMINIFGSDESQTERNSRTRVRQAGYSFERQPVETPYRSSDDEIGGRLRPAAEFRRTMRESTEELEKKPKEKGRVMRSIGIALGIFGAVVSTASFFSNVGYDGFFSALMQASIAFTTIGAPGLALAFWGNSILGKSRRYHMYAQMIGSSKEVSIDRLAGAMGVSYDKACSDLRDMLGGGYLEGYYLDVERRVVTTERLKGDTFNYRGSLGGQAEGEGDKPEQKENPADRMRMINGEIIHPEVSRKIMRLETLTRRIYSYTEMYPEKEKNARSFKERYLPKTLSILESYARFEQSGSSGENVRAAMQDVEAVLDVLIGCFEKQLDMLYMDEALNVTADIDVLERMMSGDGLKDSPFAELYRQEQGE